MKTNIMRRLPATASDQEKLLFLEEEKAKGYWTGVCTDGEYISVKQ